MFVKLHRINKTNTNYYLSEIVVNVSHISYLKENREFKIALSEGKIDIGLTQNAEFSDVVLNKSGTFETITVVGGVDIVESKINSTTKQILRG